MKIENWKLKINRGFTLVELLIVIALIGILAGAIIATLNPIEQVNKARDTRYKNDAAELLAAVERYYASTQSYPWVAGGDISIEDAFGGMGADEEIGVCGDENCSTDGVLIDTGELKNAFKNKEQFKAGEAINKFFVRKSEGAGGSVYVCFIPKAGTNRDKTKNPNLVLVDICDGGTENCTSFKDPEECTPPAQQTGWSSASTACFICVPE